MIKQASHAIVLLALLMAAAPAHGQEVQRFDPIYDHNSEGDHHLRGDAVWVVFARCAAFHRNVDLRIENHRDDRAYRARMVTPFTPEAEAAARLEAAQSEQLFIREGLRIMAEDRPGQNVEPDFHAQVDREFADLMAFPYMSQVSWEMYAHRCRAFSRSMQQHGLTAARRLVRGPGISVSVPLTHEMIARIRARDGG